MRRFSLFQARPEDRTCFPFCAICFGVLVTFALTGCAPPANPPAPAADSTHTIAAPLTDWFADYDRDTLPPFTPPDSTTALAWVDATLAAMSLDEKLGQLLIVDLRPRDLPGLRNAVEAVRDWHVGGFLVPRLMSPINVLLETQRLQAVADVPLFFAADYERGAGRFNNNLTELPANMALGAGRRPELAEAAGRLTALESRTLGVNLLFAPVVDVNNNPDNPIINTRSYGEAPALVGQMAAAFVRGAQQEGVMTTLKHFPGHGNTAVDSHTSLGAVASTVAELDSVELGPYRVILSGPVPPAGVMSAHLWVQAVDAEEVPATFSQRALTGLLREDLGFDGFVTTDALRMGALVSRYTEAERALRPLLAGADILLTPSNPARILRHLKAAVASGDLTEARIDQSVRRLLRAKAFAGLPWRHPAHATERLRYLEAKPRGAAIAEAIAEEAATLLRRTPALPLADAHRVFVLQLTNQAEAESIERAMERFATSLGPNATSLRVAGEPDDATRAAVRRGLSNADVVVLALYLRTQAGRGNVRLDDGQEDLVRQALDGTPPTLLVPFGNPYVADRFPEADGILVLYDQTLETVTAAAAVLRGDLPARGRLPISLNTFGYGDGLHHVTNQ